MKNKTFPYYLQTDNGQVQIKRINEVEHSIVAVRKSQSTPYFERFLDMKSKTGEHQSTWFEDVNRYQASTEEAFLSILMQYCDEIAEIRNKFFPQ